jgi:GT2 family glycosyltransferase
MKNNLQAKLCTCIVPFYNEGDRVLHVLSILTKVKGLAAVIAVDGGSTDTAYQKIGQQFPQVKLVRMKQSEGKSEAVWQGLQEVETEYVMLIDADLHAIRRDEMEHAIKIVHEDPTVDMLVFKRETDPWFSKIIRGDVTVTGERILRTTDLAAIYKGNPTKYQLEFAINFYMTEHHKRSYWIPWHAENTPKVKKVGLVEGMSRELAMYRHIVAYGGLLRTLVNIATFCWKEYPLAKLQA